MKGVTPLFTWANCLLYFWARKERRCRSFSEGKLRALCVYMMLLHRQRCMEEGLFIQKQRWQDLCSTCMRVFSCLLISQHLDKEAITDVQLAKSLKETSTRDIRALLSSACDIECIPGVHSRVSVVAAAGIATLLQVNRGGEGRSGLHSHAVGSCCLMYPGRILHRPSPLFTYCILCISFVSSFSDAVSTSNCKDHKCKQLSRNNHFHQPHSCSLSRRDEGFVSKVSTNWCLIDKTAVEVWVQCFQ